MKCDFCHKKFEGLIRCPECMDRLTDEIIQKERETILNMLMEDLSIEELEMIKQELLKTDNSINKIRESNKKFKKKIREMRR